MKYSLLSLVLMSMSLSASVNTFALDTTAASPQASTSDIVLTENTRGVTPQEIVTSSEVVLVTDPVENTGIPSGANIQDTTGTSENSPSVEGVSGIESSTGSTATGKMVITKPISTNTCKVNGQEVDCTQIV